MLESIFSGKTLSRTTFFRRAGNGFHTVQVERGSVDFN